MLPSYALWQVDKLGQMLVREIQELAKKNDHEKTQRICMQRWAATGHLLWAISVLLLVPRPAGVHLAASVCLCRATREALERLEATVARQDAELAELRAHVDRLSAPWVTRVLRATWQLFLGPCSSNNSAAAESASSSSKAGGAMPEDVADRGATEAAAAGRGSASAQDELVEPLLSNGGSKSGSPERTAGGRPVSATSHTGSI